MNNIRVKNGSPPEFTYKWGVASAAGWSEFHGSIVVKCGSNSVTLVTPNVV